jgi:hypothetical protein
MQRIHLRLDALEVESFETHAAGVMYAAGPNADYDTGNDHCSGPTYVVVTCASCGDDYGTCFDNCEGTCDYTCADTCDWNTGAKTGICPE